MQQSIKAAQNASERNSVLDSSASSLLEKVIRRELTPAQQILECAGALTFTFLLGWWIHDEFYFTPVLLCLVASVFLALVTDLRITIVASLLSALAADYFFEGPPGKIDFDLHFFLRVALFVTTAFFANYLVGMLRRAYLKSNEAMRDARRANRDKDEILAILAHDLRSPLSAANLSIQMIERQLPDTEPNQNLLRHAHRARESCKRVNSLVLDLLDSAKIETGGLALHCEQHDLTSILQNLSAELKLVAAQTGVILQVPIPSGPLPLYCDSNRIAQLISNLVGNALKFTPKGGLVRLEIETAKREARITVSDTGIGMSQEQLARIFDRFWQADRSQRSGVGLGLFIVKAIVDAHKGRIRVESTPGKGTTFTVDLPSC
ncbi:MAG TPA: HAMP domain-containing sensor histidine kinase [Bdellovibrionota bacterium]|jgi:signal transduction histidine kinase